MHQDLQCWVLEEERELYLKFGNWNRLVSYYFENDYDGYRDLFRLKKSVGSFFFKFRLKEKLNAS